MIREKRVIRAIARFCKVGLSTCFLNISGQYLKNSGVPTVIGILKSWHSSVLRFFSSLGLEGGLPVGFPGLEGGLPVGFRAKNMHFSKSVFDVF